MPRETTLLAGMPAMFLPSKSDMAAAGLEQAGDGVERGGLARAVGADEGDDLALVDLEGDALDGVDVAVVDVHVLDFEKAHWPSSFLRPRYASMTVGSLLDLLRRALGDDAAVVEHADALADAHDQAHVVLDEHHGDLELVADFDDAVHQFLGLVGVHARGRLVQQKQRGVRGQRAHDLQAPLRAVGQRAGLGGGHVLHIENGQQLQRPLVLLFLLFPEARQAEDAGKHAVGHLVVQADAHVVLHAHVAKEADVLETCAPRPVCWPARCSCRRCPCR